MLSLSEYLVTKLTSLLTVFHAWKNTKIVNEAKSEYTHIRQVLAKVLMREILAKFDGWTPFDIEYRRERRNY